MSLVESTANDIQINIYMCSVAQVAPRLDVECSESPWEDGLQKHQVLELSFFLFVEEGAYFKRKDNFLCTSACSNASQQLPTISD